MQTYGINYTYYDRQDTTPTFPSKLNGANVKLDWQNDIELAKSNIVTAGLVLGQESINASGIGHETQDTTAVYVQDSATFWNRLFLTGGVRYEYLSIAGDDTTYRFTGGVPLPDPNQGARQLWHWIQSADSL